MGLVNNNGTISIDFKLDLKRYRLTGLGQWEDDLAKARANLLEQTIRADIKSGKFISLETYKQATVKPETASPINNVLDWSFQKYKHDRGDSLSKSELTGTHPTALRIIPTLDSHLMSVSVLTKLRDSYADSTLYKALIAIQSSVNHSKPTGYPQITEWMKNLRDQLKPNKSGRSGQSYSDDEINLILEAFRLDTYSSKFTAFKHSHYYDFVKCLVMTGCRPEEIIALTTNDIVTRKGKRYLSITKSYTKSELRLTTKTGEQRLIPLWTELDQLLSRNVSQKSNLLFRGQSDGYISLKTFTTRYMKPVVEGLFKDGLLESDNLRTYNLRHSRITKWLNNGMSDTQAAALAGTSPEMLRRTYTDKQSIRDNVDMSLIS